MAAARPLVAVQGLDGTAVSQVRPPAKNSFSALLSVVLFIAIGCPYHALNMFHFAG